MSDSLIFIFGFFVFVVAASGLLFSVLEIRKMYPKNQAEKK